MNKNIFIPDSEGFEKIKKEFKKDGLQKIHIIADFDRTLTSAYINKEKTPSLIAILREDGKYLGDDYATKAQKLFEKYHPMEIDLNIDIKKKKKEMKNWWERHFKLLIKSKLNKKQINEIANSGRIKLRKNCLPFLSFLNFHKIPLIIMSASGLGEEAISVLLRKNKSLYSNIHIISNSLLYNKKGLAIDFKKPVIHSLNKDETTLNNLSFFKKIKQRKNVILLGDNIEDIKMVDGFDYDKLIKIGFLNDNIKERIENYEKVYDVIILNDGSMQFINNLLNYFIK
jgi:5'-nucleotidase